MNTIIIAGTLIPKATTLHISLLNRARAKHGRSGCSAGVLISNPIIPIVIGIPQLSATITEKFKCTIRVTHAIRLILT